jgi:putative ABC transport system ATP-binding protein
MIEVKGLCKSFGDKIIFENFDLNVNTGEFVIITGNSGSGKSTLLNMIGRLEKFNSGSITIDGILVGNYNSKKFYGQKIGFLFQNFSLIDNKTVEENLKIISDKNRTNLSIQEALTKVGLESKLKTKIYKLSGGEQQRIALARLMIKKNDIILADEPTGSLDEINSKLVMNILKELNKEGKTVVMVTHDKNIVREAERVVYI